jgi:hypothetical protein
MAIPIMGAAVETITGGKDIATGHTFLPLAVTRE